MDLQAARAAPEIDAAAARCPFNGEIASRLHLDVAVRSRSEVMPANSAA
jgi:hypothetical protein